MSAPAPAIYKACYSGVPVYEMPCHGVAVMRRKADAWLNATQILKVAGFDKPQRTRVLEREVQKNTHEKVQGGYGKYQGESPEFSPGALAGRPATRNRFSPNSGLG
jgi:transcription factor MBP1